MGWEGKKGAFIEGQLADMAVLSNDFFTIPDEEIKSIYSVMTILGGDIVHASDEFSSYNPPLPPVSPDWSPIKHFGTYGQNKTIVQHQAHAIHCLAHRHPFSEHTNHLFGCFCWAF